ncbi:MAG: TIGR02757 family protein [Candidatus Hydrogenedentes bacterium]|nr:TIGR02757 family protein [Candidatus Hydrogenedentota bacterium]
MSIAPSEWLNEETLLYTRLERLYAALNRREYVSPDPLQFLYGYPEPADREVAGLVSSSLAFGNVKQILRSVGAVLDRMPQPARFLRDSTQARLAETFDGFRHRFVTGDDLAGMLFGVKEAVEAYGSLERCFASKVLPGQDTVIPALSAFVDALRGEGGPNYLLPDPARGSACKRLHLYLRWMVREDDVDPGGWTSVSPAQLVVPLDTHMHRIARALGLTARASGDIRTAMEVTAAFRALAPADPVRYDFALTRLGIRNDTNACDFFPDCGL